ncbi:MAG TPA: glycosyl hydrolase [Pedobacter sp.]|uniref:glycosyl hydrolase n=1 Tax=Pedobacter sp. TaxID=1411316 RepID=UPI002B9755C4|nr:glycosyl hydrolase [Pedobacter sp.]HMI01044.1 glycosyl hydrolase [Pedobacter sp.]
MSSRPGAFWCWLNGNMTTTSITRDLEEMKSKGTSRAEIWDVAAVNGTIPAGGPFLGDESAKLIKHAISEGKRLQIKIGIIASSGWNAGGSWVKPDWASKALYFSETQLNSSEKVSIELPFPKLPPHCPVTAENIPEFYKEVAVLAIPFHADKTIARSSDIINLSSKFSNGKLTWKVPKGKWTIIRFICSNTGQSLIVPSPNSKGLFIDFLDPEATKRHLKYFMDRLGVTPENSAEGGLAYFEFDSMELEKGTPWTDAMPAIFKTRQGYPIEKYLTVFAGWKIEDQTDRFLYDFKKTISDQLIYSHYTTGTAFLKKYNAELVAESGGPGPPVWETCPVDALKALGSVSVPRGEFWIRHRNMFLIKEVASAAHIYGKKMVDAESFTTWRRWKDSPYEMKKYADRAFCEGLNNITFHTFASTTPEDGYPGRTYHAGSDVNTATTWWNKSKPFMDYLSRCSYLLQQGLFTADVCYYYGDQAPNFFPFYHNVPEKPTLPGLEKGYDFDVINSDVIISRMSVKDGRLVLPDGMSYAVLLLPDQASMPLSVLRKIEKLVKDGATVIGNPPTIIPGLHNAAEETLKLNQLADKLWGAATDKQTKSGTYGKGTIFCGLSATEVLQLKGIERDFIFNGPSELDYIHRSTDFGEVYFIRNESDNWVKGEASFRIFDKNPKLWDPATGTRANIKTYTAGRKTTQFTLELAPHGSVFVVFSDKKQHETKADLFSTTSQPAQEMQGLWKLTFPKGWGAPEEVLLEGLKSWTEFKDKGIKYFSGTATYHKTFSIKEEIAGKTISIDLGEVRDLAEVFINGKSAGILWKKPFSADITKLVRPGDNSLTVEVVNLWVNRLTGDMLSEPKDRFTRTNQPYMKGEIWPGGDETFRIQTSGLLGPVKLFYAK